MVILEFYQGDYQKELVAFDSLKEGRGIIWKLSLTEISSLI